MDSIRVNQAVQPYNRDYLGGVRLLQDSGFDPFSDRSPAKSALNQVFSDFSRRLPGAGSAEDLESNYLNSLSPSRKLAGLYDTLEQSFAPTGPGRSSPLVSYLNDRVDLYVSERDQDADGALSSQEAGLKRGEISSLDGNRDGSLTTGEIKQGLANGNAPLRRILDFFRTPPGQVVDLYA